MVLTASERRILDKRRNPLNIRSNQQLLNAHTLTHAAGFQASMGCKQARDEHAVLVREMGRRGLNHNSPFKCLVGRRKMR